MFEAIIAGTLTVFQPDILAIIAIGVVIGLLFGILPGLSGIVALAILIPLIYDMDRVYALTFLLAVHAVVYSGGAVGAILLNIPGAPPNAATVIDGFPMTKKGKSGQALGAAFVASMLGGIFGAFVLAVLIPVVSTVVMAFGSPETFFLGVLALSFVAIISEESTVKGLISGGLGVLLIGAHCTGIEALFQLREGANLNRRTAVVGAVGGSFSFEKGIDPGRLAR